MIRRQKKKNKKKSIYTSSRQLRSDQAPDSPWANRLIYTDRIDVTNVE